MGTIKLESFVNDGRPQISFTIEEGIRSHRLVLYSGTDQHWIPKLQVDFTGCENKEVWVVLQNIANALGHIATTVAGTEGEKITQLMKLL